MKYKYAKLEVLQKSVLSLLMILVLSTLFQQSQAAVVGLTGQANRNLIQDGTSATVSIVWTGASGVANPPAGAIGNTVFSNSGTFTLPNNTALGVNNSRVATNVTLTPTQPNVAFTVRENLQIPANIIYSARKQGSTVFFYTRTFADTSVDAGTSTNTVQFQITNSANGQLSFSRIDLRFDNDQTVRVVPVGTQISSIASINYNGAGLFDYDWEIATPASTQGTAFFSTLYTQRKYLGAGREAYIQSPNLPTDETGVYFIRLNIRSPQTGFEPVQIRYVVIDSNIGPDPVKLEEIRLSSPLPQAVLQEDTMFDWESVDDTKAYQLELFEFIHSSDRPETVRSLEDIEVKVDWEKEVKDRTTGILVHGDLHEIQLSAIARQHLRAGYKYRWRVIAIGVQGNIIATSPLRTISVPK